MKQPNQDSQMHCPPEWEKEDNWHRVEVKIITYVNCDNEEQAEEIINKDLFDGDMESWLVESVEQDNDY